MADPADGHLLSIPWQKPPSKKSRQILIPDGVSKSEIRPTRIERRARLVSAIARGRRWLDEIVLGAVTDVQQIATRQKCSVRQVNMTISLAFLAPDLVRAAVEGRLPRGIGVERLRDAPSEWGRQFEVLGLNPGSSQTGIASHPNNLQYSQVTERYRPSKASRRERNFSMQRRGAKNRPERLQVSSETEKAEPGRRISPQKRPVSNRRRFRRFWTTGWWCAQSYANPSQRRFHTGNRGNPLF